MKRINNEMILDTIYDLADNCGLRIDEFLSRVEEEFGDQPINVDSLPEEVVNELNTARASKKQQRKEARLQKDREEINAQIKRFREIFPDVPADDIPDSVWEDVRGGTTLAHAYALYLVESEAEKRYASAINERNGNAGARVSGETASEPTFTKEQVERMSGKEVKHNYKNILNAMKNWKYN